LSCFTYDGFDCTGKSKDKEVATNTIEVKESDIPDLSRGPSLYTKSCYQLDYTLRRYSYYFSDDAPSR